MNIAGRPVGPMTTEMFSILAEQGLVSAAKVAVLNLEAIKNMLGPKWERVEGLVLAFFERAIKRSLRPGENYFKSGELSYVVLCPSLTVEETQAKCAEFSKEICRQLFGEEGIEVAMRNCVGQVDRRLLRTYQTMTAAIDRALEQHGKETVIFRDRDRIDEMATRQLCLNLPQRPDRQVPCAESDLGFIYRPIWDGPSRVVRTYLCQPLPPEGFDDSFLNTTGVCSPSKAAECALLDRATLAHCAKRIDTMNRGERAILALPAHFSTLSHTRAWRLFDEVYRQIPPVILRELVFVILGLSGVPNVRIVQELAKLSGARQVFCVAEPDGTIAARFAFTRVHAIGMTLPEVPCHEKSLSESIRSLAADARKNGHESFVLGVTSASRAAIAVAAGVRYLEGPAIHPLVTRPRGAFLHDPEELCVAKADRAQSGARQVGPRI